MMRAGAVAVGGLTVVGATQALYLQSQYKPLPEARGPLRGVAAWAQQIPIRKPMLSAAKTQAPSPRVAAVAAAAAAASAAARKGQCDGAEGDECSGGDGDSKSMSGACGLLSRLSSGVANMERSAGEAEEAPDEGFLRCEGRRNGKGGAVKNVLFVGDSLVTGVGQDPASSHGPALPRAVADIICRVLRVDCTWTAIGQTGANIATLHSKLLPAVVKEVAAKQESGQHVDIVVVICGLNDFKHAYMSRRNTVSSFRHDLSTFVRAIQEETGVECTIVLPALPVHRAPVFNGIWPLQPMLTKLASWWDQEKEDLAQHVRGVSFVRHAEKDETYSHPMYWASDGIHPNDLGYRIWGEHIGLSILKEVLLPKAQGGA